MGKNPTEHTPGFDKGWALLTSYQKQQVLGAIDLFRHNPTHESLRTHVLRNSDVTSISADDDLRILLRVRPDGSILLLDVGSHERVYGE